MVFRHEGLVPLLVVPEDGEHRVAQSVDRNVEVGDVQRGTDFRVEQLDKPIRQADWGADEMIVRDGEWSSVG